MRAFIAALPIVFLIMGAAAMAEPGKSAEELVFEKHPYLTAAQAIAAGDTAALQYLIAQGLDVNYEGRETNTPWGRDTVTLLVWAVLQDQPACVELLLKAGADADKGTRRGLTPLIMSIMAIAKSDEIFSSLLVRHHADPNKIYAGDETALTLVLRDTELGDKRWPQAEMLLKHGADIDLDIGRGDTALVRLSLQGRWRAVLWLLEHGANYEARGWGGCTALDWLHASYRRHSVPPESQLYRDKVRDWLLAHGVARFRMDPALIEELLFEKVEHAAAHIRAAKAISARDEAALKAAIAEGLDLDQESRAVSLEKLGQDRITLAIWALVKDWPDGLKILLEAGANVNKPSDNGVTLLALAAERSDGLFERLLEHHGADPNQPSQRQPPLLKVLFSQALADGNRQNRRAELLLARGADMDRPLVDGRTVLHLAADAEVWLKVLWLLEHGANYEVRDARNWTLMDYLRHSYKAYPKSDLYRDKVRDWLLAHGVARSRMDPAIHPEPDYRD